MNAPLPTPTAKEIAAAKVCRKGNDDLSIHRVPPNSVEAEQGVLGCVLLDPKCLDECAEALKVSSFYDLRHQEIFEAMIAIGPSVDTISLYQRLKDGNKVDSVGGLAYLSDLPNNVPSAANVSFYINIVREKQILRNALSYATDIVGRIYEHEGQVDELIGDIEKQALEIRGDRGMSSMRDAKTLTRAVIERMEAAHSGNVSLGLRSGFPDLDNLNCGLHPGMIVLAARPSCGKTSLAMQIAEHVSLDQNVPVGVFSLEMSAEDLMARAICGRAKVPLHTYRSGQFTDRDFPKIGSVAAKMANAPLYIDDSSSLPISTIRARGRRMVAEHGVRLIVIDYMQLAKDDSPQSQRSREREISAISSGVKAMSKELNIPVIVLAQLNREADGGKPRLSHLRESGSIEQDADEVWLLSKDGDDDPTSEGQSISLEVAKQRNGPCGIVKLIFLKPYTRMESVSRMQMPEGHPLAD